MPGESQRLTGSSEVMRLLREEIRRFAPTRDAILIRGESGTGKELVARELHAQSSRRDRPFVPLNCASLNEGTAESELFGAERGSYTGAEKRAGLLAAAHGGTIFLDEIGDLGLQVQAKLLRTLQEGTVRSVGGAERPLDLRVLAATHQPLEALVESGRFRFDLLKRFVKPIHVPPLRERLEDLREICDAIITRERQDEGRNSNARTIADEVEQQFRLHTWPGNVRELENAIKQALTVSRESGHEILVDSDFPRLSRESSSTSSAAACRALRAIAESIIEDLDELRLPPTSIPDLAASRPELGLAHHLAETFLARKWNDVDAAAQRLFGYADADTVRKRRRPARG